MSELNPFKAALARGESQIGLWLGLGPGLCTEICAGAGFDWLLIDGEHAPNGVAEVLRHAQIIAGYPGVNAVARVPVGEAHIVKQFLDTGVQTILVPMVDTPEHAARMVAAMRYPQAGDGLGGVRGMAGARASRWGRRTHYANQANDEVCLLVQAETREAIAQLDAIAATPGVDGVFIGPADLSASMGFPGNSNHPEVQATIEQAIRRVRAAGKAPGILTSDEAQARHYLALGAQFVAVGTDTGMLARHSSALAQAFKPGLAGGDAGAPPSGPRVY